MSRCLTKISITSGGKADFRQSMRLFELEPDHRCTIAGTTDPIPPIFTLEGPFFRINASEPRRRLRLPTKFDQTKSASWKYKGGMKVSSNSHLFHATMSLWARTTKKYLSTGPLAHPLACSLTPLIRSLAHSLPSSWHSE